MLKETKIVNELVAELARALGDGWAVCGGNGPDSDRDYLINSAHLGFKIVVKADESAHRFLRFDEVSDDARIKVYGGYPRDGNVWYNPRGESSPGITVAYNRGVEAIAREIGRRFLPDALEWYQKSVAYIQNEKAYLETQQQMAERLAAASGGKLGYRGGNQSEPQVYSTGNQPHYYIKNFYPGTGSVAFDISGVDMETALQIAAILKTAERPK